MRAFRIAGAASALLLACLPAQAGDGTSLSVTATVVSKNNCTFDTTTPNTLGFGAIDPSTSSNATSSVVWTFTCRGSAKTASFVVTVGNGLYHDGGTRRMRHGTDATAFLPYSATASPASGNATKNVPVTLTITGTVLAWDFRGAIAGSYSDTVTVSLNP